MVKFLNRILCLVLVWGQLFNAQLLYAVEIDKELNYICKRATFPLDVYDESSQTLTSFRSHEVHPSSNGSFRLAFEPDFYNQDMDLFLIHNQTPVGQLRVSGNNIQFQGLENFHFQFESLSNIGLPLLKALAINVNGSLTLLEGYDCEVAHLKAPEISIEKTLNCREALRLQGLESCTIRGSVVSPLALIQARRFSHEGTLKCSGAIFDIEQGKDTTESLVQADQDILLRNFTSFQHAGQFRAKRSITTEGQNYHSLPGSHTFAGVIHRATGETYVDAGRMMAQQSVLNVQNLELTQDFEFIGNQLQGHSGFKLQADSNKLRPRFGLQLQSDNILNYNGEAVLTGVDQLFPYWEYDLGPCKLEDVLLKTRDSSVKSLVKQTRLQINAFQNEILPQWNPLYGVYLQAKGNLTHRGKVSTKANSIFYEGRTVNLSESSQSRTGFLEHNGIVIRAVKSFCDGLLKTPHQVSFFIDELLKLTGIIDSPLTTVLFSRPTPVEINPISTPSVFEQTEPSRVSGDLMVSKPDYILLGGHLDGSFVGNARKNAIVSGQVNKNVWLAGENTTLTQSAWVGKDYTANAAGNATIAGPVEENAQQTGQNTLLAPTGKVGKDYTADATGNATIAGPVEENAQQTGQNTLLAPTGKVGRDYTANASGNATIAGPVEENVQQTGQNTSLDPRGKVGKDYTANATGNATIAGPVEGNAQQTGENTSVDEGARIGEDYTANATGNATIASPVGGSAQQTGQNTSLDPRGKVGKDYTANATGNATIAGPVEGNAQQTGQNTLLAAIGKVGRNYRGKATQKSTVSGHVGANADLEGQKAEQTQTSTVGGDLTVKANDFFQSGFIHGTGLFEVKRTHQTRTGIIRNGLQTIGAKAESVVLEGKTHGDVFLHTSQFRLEETGETNSNNFLLRADSSVFAGSLRTRHMELDSPVTHIRPSGDLFIDEHGNLKALTYFLNQGRVYSANSWYTEFGDIYDLGNLKAAGWLTLKARSHPNLQDILNGRHPSFLKSGGIHFIESDSVKLHSIFRTPCNIGITAPYINIYGPVSMSRDLMLETTVGSLHLRFPISVRSLFLTSARNLSTSNVRFQNQLIFNAKGSYENAQQPFAHDRFMGRYRFGFHRPGTIIGPNGFAQITAASILNPSPMSLMDTNFLILRAILGDILNYGTFRGRTYLEKYAHGNIIDQATLSYTMHGKRMIPFYISAQNIGGTGIDYTDAYGQVRKVGLKAVAGVQILNNASGYQAIGDIFLQGTKGFSAMASSQEYLESSHTKKSGLLKHKKKTRETWNTAVCNPFIVSQQGRIFYHVPEGGLNLIGCHVFGRDGDFAIVRDQITYGHLVGQTRVQTRKSSYWGASKSKRSETHEFPIITRIENGSLVYHQSLLKGILGTGVFIQAPLYYGKAKEKITFDGIQLHHSVRQISSSVLPSFFGSDAVFKGESIGSSIARSDPLGNSVTNFRNAQGAVNKFSQGVKTGVQAWQDMNMFSNAYAQSHLPQALLSRVGNVGVEATRSSFHHQYTTTSPSLLNVGGLILESDTGVELLGGTQALIESLFRVRAPYLTLEKATNESDIKSRSASLSVGYNGVTRTPSASGSYQSSRTHSTTHQNACVHVYGQQGVVDLGDLPLLNLNGGVMRAPHFQGRVGTLTMTSYQDEFTSRSDGFSGGMSGSPAQGMSGSLSISQGKSHEKRVNQHSGLIATQGFDRDFTIHQLNVVDTELDPVLARHANSTSFTKLYDVSKSNHVSLGISNVDFTTPTSFLESLGKSTAVMGASFLAAEGVRMLGGNDFVTSVTGTLTSLGTSALVNHLMSPEDSGLDPKVSASGFHPMPSGLTSLGELSYSRNGKQTTIMAMDLNIQQLGNGLRVMERAAEKFEDALSQIRVSAPEDVQSQVDVLGEANKIMDKAGLTEQEKVQLLEEVSPVLVDAVIQDEKDQGRSVQKKVRVKTKDKKPVIEMALQAERRQPTIEESLFELEQERPRETREGRSKERKNLKENKRSKSPPPIPTWFREGESFVQECADTFGEFVQPVMNRARNMHSDLHGAIQGKPTALEFSSDPFARKLTEDEFIQNRLELCERKKGPLSAQEREFMTYKLKKIYHVLRLIDFNRSWINPGQQRFEELAGLSFEEFRVKDLSEMDPKKLATTKGRQDAERIIRNHYNYYQSQRFNLAVAPVLGIFAGVASLSPMLRGRGPLVSLPESSAPVSRNIQALDLTGATKIKRGEHPWTIRQGQEWKEKIVGKAQKTGTEGHATRSYREAIAAVKGEEVERVYLNRGYKKATGEPVKPNRRPDVTVVRKDGKIEAIEVQSKSDKPKELRLRNEEAMRQLPPEKEGKVRIIKPTVAKGNKE